MAGSSDSEKAEGVRTAGRGENSYTVVRNVTSDPWQSLPFTLPDRPSLVEEPPLAAVHPNDDKNRWGSSIALTLPVLGRPCRVLLDTGGGQSSYLSETWAKAHGKVKSRHSEPYTLQGVLGETITRAQRADLTLHFGKFKGNLEGVKLAPLRGYDLILGLDFFDRYVESIAPDLLRFRDQKGKLHNFHPSKIPPTKPSLPHLAAMSDSESEASSILLTRHAFRRAMRKQGTECFVAMLSGEGDTIGGLVDGRSGSGAEEGGPRVDPAPGSEEAAVLGTPKISPDLKESEFKSKLSSTLSRYRSRFPQGVPHIPAVSQDLNMLIDTGDAKPIAQKGRPMSPRMLEERGHHPYSSSGRQMALCGCVLTTGQSMKSPARTNIHFPALPNASTS